MPHFLSYTMLNSLINSKASKNISLNFVLKLFICMIANAKKSHLVLVQVKHQLCKLERNHFI